MLPKWHVLIGFVFSYTLIYFFNISFSAGTIIFLSSFLIDADHYLYYAFYKKDWNPIHSVKWFYNLIEKHKKLTIAEKKMIKGHILIFHGIEFWAVLLLSGIYFNKLFLFVLTGVGIHMVADWTYLIRSHKSVYLKFSQTWIFIRNKNTKGLREL